MTSHAVVDQHLVVQLRHVVFLSGPVVYGCVEVFGEPCDRGTACFGEAR